MLVVRALRDDESCRRAGKWHATHYEQLAVMKGLCCVVSAVPVFSVFFFFLPWMCYSSRGFLSEPDCFSCSRGICGTY